MATSNFDPIERDEPLRTSYSRRGRRGLGVFTMIVGVAAVAAIAAIGVYAFKAGERRGAEGIAPTIVANVGPDKVRPDTPGGMQVPNQDKQIYDRLAPDRGQGPPRVERLLPPPEAPMAPPRAPVPAPQAAEQIPLLSAPPATPKIATAPELMKPRDSIEAPSLSAPAQQPQAPASPATPTARDAAKVAAVAPASGGYRVQIASLRTPEDAQATIARVKKTNGDLFTGLSFDVKRAEIADKGVYYRVQVGPLADASAATGLCDRLKDRKVGCVIVRP